MKEKTFEQNLEELEKLITGLEQGELSLEESLQVFEQGTATYKKCQQFLNQAEKKVKVISDSLEVEEFES